jgi:2-C-methyl-D-erythritol 4-phosphate cytidylyltransferase
MADVSVIVLAAGKSERFAGKDKKPFVNLDGRPIFIRCLEMFINREDVAQTILVVPAQDADRLKEKYAANLGFMGVQMVAGGEERHHSVANALQKVKEDSVLVAVHDGIRPCVTEEMINAVFAEARKSGAAILANPLTGTVKRVSEAKVVDETLSRLNLWEAQTPQVFKRDVLMKAYAAADKIAEPITDDAQLVERSGHPVSVVASDGSNIKITARGDLALASAILKSRPAKKAKAFGAFEEAQW